MKVIANKSILHNNTTGCTFIASQMDEDVQTGTRENDSHIEWMGDLTIPANRHTAPLIEALEEAKKSKWIHVAESLPKHRSYVVISYWSGYDIAEYKHGCFFVGLNRIADVKYWMLLEDPETALLNAKS